MDRRALQQKLREFRQAYTRLAEDGYCDEPGGMEYRRVREEWVYGGASQDVDGFIRWRANIGPFEEETVT